MAKNQTGIAIALKAWLPTGATLDEQIANLQLVKTAHQTKKSCSWRLTLPSAKPAKP